MAQVADFTIDQGSTSKVVFRLFSNAAKTARKDLSGFAARMKVRKEGGDREVVWSGDTNVSGLVIADSDTGEIEATFAAADTALWSTHPTPFYLYDIEIAQGGNVTRVAQGRIFLSAEVTS